MRKFAFRKNGSYELVSFGGVRVRGARFHFLPEQGEQIIYGSLLFTVKSLEDTKIGTVDILYSPADALQE